jgi:DNA-binding NtrC family response regulator
MKTEVLLADEMVDMRPLVQLVLEDAGYQVLASRSLSHTLDVLRARAELLVVLQSTRSGTALLKAALRDPDIGRHAFVLLCAYPEGLPASWRELLDALNVPVLTLPFDLEELYRTISEAAQRLSVGDEHPLPA